MTVKSATTPACAACKYQRRKCTPICPLAPYFPANQPKMFQNVHRLFGVSNITKTLNSLKTKDQKEDAMKSIIYEAEMRHRFPQYGCSAIICQLRFQLQYTLEELRYVHAYLAALRDHWASNRWPSAQLEYGSSLMNDAPSAIQGQSKMNLTVSQFLLNENSGFNAEYPECMARPVLLDYCSDTVTNNNLTTIQGQMDSLSVLPDRNVVCHDMEGDPSFYSRVDDRQSYIETRETFESSSDSSPKNTTLPAEHISERELKTAAAGFSLTTII